MTLKCNISPDEKSAKTGQELGKRFRELIRADEYEWSFEELESRIGNPRDALAMSLFQGLKLNLKILVTRELQEKGEMGTDISKMTVKEMAIWLNSIANKFERHDEAVARMAKEQKDEAKATAQNRPEDLTKDKASVSETPLGGIDLNAANLDLQIKRDGKGVPLPLQLQDMEKLRNIQGFVPVIINIVPVTSLPFLSELQGKSQPPQALPAGRQSLVKAS